MEKVEVIWRVKKPKRWDRVLKANYSFCLFRQYTDAMFYSLKVLKFLINFTEFCKIHLSQFVFKVVMFDVGSYLHE